MVLPMRRLTVGFLFLLLLSFNCYGQVSGSSGKDSLTNRIIEQIIRFHQEKIYLHIDRPVYIAGETIWFRAHVADAVLHTPVTKQYVYAELLSPLDSVVERVKVRADSGAFAGYIKLDQALPEGDYTLCAWTENMLNPGADYHFRKNIRVVGPFSATVNTVVTFRSEKGDRVTAEVAFYDIKSNKKILPGQLRMRINDQPLSEVETDRDTISRFQFRLPKESDRRVLYVETGKSREYIPVPYSQNDYEVYFFPEGGYIPSGAEVAVAFKALSGSGMPEHVTGKIVDNAGNKFADLETLHDGMGLFLLKADTVTEYYAVCTNEQGLEKSFKLPIARNRTYTLSTELSGDSLYVSVITSSDIQQQKKLFLMLHTRGIVHYAEPWDSSYSTVSFDSRRFPSGVLQAILLDDNMMPLSERLVFCLNNDQSKVNIETDGDTYQKRQKVNASVQVSGTDSLPRAGSFSVSVTDDNDIKPDTSVTILTTLLLTSELRGYINNPGFYFQEDNPITSPALNLLMMTNGWRRYDIPAAMAGRYQEMKYPLKSGMEITGSIRSLILGKSVAKAEVTIFSWGSDYFNTTLTDNNGRFVFGGIEFRDSTEFVVQALNKTGKPTVDLVLDREFFPTVTALPARPTDIITENRNDEQMSRYITRADTKYTMENGMRTVYIEEVIIKAKAPEKKNYSFSYYMPQNPQSSGNMIDYEQIEEMHPIFLSEIIYHIPFTRVENGKVIIERMRYNLNLLLENASLPAVLVLDDMIIEDYDIDMIDPYSVERIAVLKGTQTVLLGGAGAGGAIVITTKKGSKVYKEAPKFNIKTITPLGLQTPAEFYSPRYETQEQREIGPPDLRTTIYWNPNVTLSAGGAAKFDFYTADTPSDYSIIIEGITSDGLIIHGRTRISRR